jgi:hypothetical protein
MINQVNAAAAFANAAVVVIPPGPPALPEGERKMRACLGQGRLGFSDQAIQYLSVQGVTDAEAFMSYPVSHMDTFITLINKPTTIQHYLPPPVAPAPARGRPAAAVIPHNPVILLYASLRGLKALRAWMDFKAGRQVPIDVDEFTIDTKGVWLHRTNRLDDDKLTIPSVVMVPLLTSMASWTVWEQQFRTYLAQFRSNMCYAPLSYIIRRDAFQTEAQMQAPLLDIDTTLVETLSFTNPYYHDDSRRVYVLLKNLTLTGPGWPHI